MTPLVSHIHCALPAQWAGCYDGGWQGEIVAGAFAHPAKIGRALIRRIYDHAFAEGWLHAGDIAVDPFGGIGGTALDAGLRGVQWIGCELEPRFSELGNDNIKLWQGRFADLPAWRAPLLLCGDSRKLSEHVARACLVVSSPPFSVRQSSANARPGESVNLKNMKANTYGHSDGQLGAMKEGRAPSVVISSPPYAGNEKSDYQLSDDGKTRRRDVKRGFKQGHGCFRGSETYGQSEGQLGTMREGSAPTLIVSSPPYAEISTGAGGLNTKPPKHARQQGGRAATTASQDTDQRYGASEGQLAKMVVGSPPYVDAQQLQDREFIMNSTAVNPTPRKVGDRSYAPAAMETEGQLARMVVGSPPFATGDSAGPERLTERTDPAATYMQKHQRWGDGGQTSDGNLASEGAETFWSAAADIVEQCRMILQPGGHAIWITKDFVRNKARVPFSDQWQALCEAHGFKLVCRHQAMLVAHHGEQDDAFGEPKQLKTERKSFFRRLAEKKGSPAIDHEDVICMVRA